MNKEVQRKIIREEFKKGVVREDHYNGKNGLTRLAIEIVVDSKGEIDYIIEKLKNLDIKPEFIIVEEKELNIAVWWFSRGYFVIFNEKQYLRLIDDFIEYVGNLEINNCQVDTGMLGDDSNQLNFEIDENLEVVINPKFNIENFSMELQGGIQVHYNN